MKIERSGYFRPTQLVTPSITRVLNAGISKWSYRKSLRRDPCVYCGLAADTYDHIIPVAKGGRKFHNIAPACLNCNTEKSNHSLLIYIWMRANRSQIQKYLDAQNERRIMIIEVESIKKAALWLRTHDDWKR